MSRTQQQEQPQKNKKQQQQKKTEKPKERIEEDPIGPVADPDLQIKGGGGRSSKP